MGNDLGSVEAANDKGERIDHVEIPSGPVTPELEVEVGTPELPATPLPHIPSAKMRTTFPSAAAITGSPLEASKSTPL